MAGERTIQFLTRPDGTRLAYFVRARVATVRPPGWLSIVGVHADNAPEKEFADALAADSSVDAGQLQQTGHRSLRPSPNRPLPRKPRERAESVVDHLRLDRFALFCASGAGCVGIAYGPASGARLQAILPVPSLGCKRRDPQFRASLVSLVDAGWDVASENLAMLMLPEVAEEVEQFGWREQQAATRDGVCASQRLLQWDVRSRLSGDGACLVLHRRNDRLVRFEAGVELASGLPTHDSSRSGQHHGLG
jgi:hypothetical protein